jgi:hypothetical protein
MKKSSSIIIIFVIVITIWLLLAPLSNAQCIRDEWLWSRGRLTTEGPIFNNVSSSASQEISTTVPVFTRNVQGRAFGPVDTSLIANPKLSCQIFHFTNVAQNPGDSISMTVKILVDGATQFSRTFTSTNDPDTPVIFEMPLPRSSAISFEFQMSIDITVDPEGGSKDDDDPNPIVPTTGFIRIKQILSGGFSKDFGLLRPVDGQLVPGGTILATGEGWEVGSETAEYRLLFDGMQVAQQGPGLSCTQQPSMSFDVPCDTVSGSHTIAIQLFDIAVQRVLAFNVNPTTLNINADFTAGKCSATVKSVMIERAFPDSLLEPNPDHAGGGLKIFPDKNSPTDSMDRRKVRVKAITDAPANGPAVTVFFRSFDIDDPSSDPIIDPNGSAGSDNRGMPREGVFSIDGVPMGRSALVETVPDPTTGKQIAEVEFTVTTHPGDNFRIAASTDQQLLDRVEVEGTNLKGPDGILSESATETAQAKATPLLTVWRRLHIELDFMDKVIGNQVSGKVISVRPNPKENTTILDVDVALPLEEGRFEKGRIVIQTDRQMRAFSVITNKHDATRRIDTIEIPALGKAIPPGNLVNQPFLLVDDDDFNKDDFIIPSDPTKPSIPRPDGDDNEPVTARPETLSLVMESDKIEENVFAAAYIQPVYDGGGDRAFDDPNIKFKLNVPKTEEDIEAQIDLGINSISSETDSNVRGRDDFWVVYLQIAYQGDSGSDDDPAGDSPNIEQGITLSLTNNKLITSQNDPVPIGGQGSLIYIETLADNPTVMGSLDTRRIVVPHELGHQFGLAHGVGLGIMSEGFGFTEKFVPLHINNMRWRVRSPGTQ